MRVIPAKHPNVAKPVRRVQIAHDQLARAIPPCIAKHFHMTVEFPEGAVVKLVVTQAMRDDLTSLFRRGLNSWDGAPEWLFQVADNLEGVEHVRRFSARDQAG